jgi:hypothetical protein
MSIYDDLTIWFATPDDLKLVMQMAQGAAEENAVLKPDIQQMLQIIWPKLNQDHGVIACIGTRGKEPEGMAVLNIGPLPYSREMAVEEVCVYVRPEFRNAKGGRARKLVEFSKSFADQMGLPLIIGVFSSINTKAKCDLYRRVLGEPSGNYWVYGRKTGGQTVEA